ncbi:MAG: phosphoglycerate kinase [Candidatus Thermoplasmatota archaeon]|nr:phosphoglycerate kinase [Candidatus Thermoplasmatota archaeon]
MDLPFLTISDLPLEGKTVLMRVDINSPVNPDTGEILSLKRIEEHARSIKLLPPCKLVLLAHQSRPGKKDYTPLKEHARSLSRVLDREVQYMDQLFSETVLERIRDMNVGEILLLENTRFYAEDVDLDDAPMKVQESTFLVRRLSSVVEYFINDAFSAVHRSQPSLVGFCGVVPSAAGPLMEKELKALQRITVDPQRPSIAILGGLKVDDSIAVAENLLKGGISDKILTTGVVGSMFTWAAGYDLGAPNINFINQEIKGADELLKRCKKVLKDHPDKVLYPSDIALNIDGERVRITIEDLPANGPIFDISLDTIVRYSNIIKDAKTIIANGPAGVFEMKQFSEGTVELFRAISESGAYSVMGGGETNMVVKTEKLSGISHVSTGGGALIGYLSGQDMPVLEALKRSKANFSSGDQ